MTVIWEKAFDICEISQTEQKDGFTSYIIDVKVSHCKWHVSRRYKQFVELHEKMVKEYGVDKNLLPPKKIFGNRSESFICERKKALEHYLQSLIQLFTILPEPLAIFLDFQKYEVRAITAALSETFFSTGEEMLQRGVSYEFTPTQLHAISERLKLGDPSYFKNPKQDIAHLVEFVTQLKHLIIIGSSECLEQSNIIPNELSFDLSLFKSAVTLEVYNCNLAKNLTSVDILRANLKTLIVHKTLENIADILLCGILHWCPITDPLHTWPFWNSITFLNFSHNRITKIHTSIKLLSSVKHIDLSHNEIQVIEHMETLSELSVLNLSHNKIQEVDSLHTRLGNIHSLNLSSNKIKSLQGFSKLFSVSELLLEYNLISSLPEISHISKLPCLETLSLQHNPVTLCVDYRPQVLLLFGSLAPELTLDGLKATEKEIDTVSILQALKQARGENSSSLVNQNLSQGESISNSYNHHQQIQKYQEQNSPENTTKKIMSNVNRSSKFRHQVETLRKIGGSDWLRLLNEIHNSEVNAEVTLNKFDASFSHSDDSLQYGSMFVGNKSPNVATSQTVERFTSSMEISYPDWLLSLDASVFQIEQQLVGQQFPDTSDSVFNHSNRDCSTLIKTSKLLWVVLLNLKDLVSEIPICILMRHDEIVFLELKKISKNSSSLENNHNLTPEFLFIRSILPADIVSLSVGPCDAYTEIKVKSNHNNHENIIVLMMDIDTTDAFVSECHNLYNIMPVYKLNPFAKKMLELEIMSSNFSLTDVSVQKQILFGQRVCVSKVLHKCQHGILHYVFVTPSHVILVEERLHILSSMMQETSDSISQPQFQVCSLVNVHSNVKQIHLKDFPEESDNSNNLSQSNNQTVKSNIFYVEDNLDILYKCGSWLIIEFDSNSSLYLNFFSLKQRNQFLDTFLCVRNQR
ncbi:uncharacterized protein [Parasteatoda tepidariorum]|uniref:uncharacterized protein isoform X2 n=1 Tax=Parasteatoda tepidariorum TaxID=114398 RepID=UPI00077FA298|nr:uncharacterized protein LOC107449681 isoform X2 [Parasteatoda tepidariorum]